MKVLITGFPGTGKSSVALELKKRGHIAYDPQTMHGYMHTYDRKTGRKIAPPAQRPKGWYDTVGAYNWDGVKLQELLQKNEDIFICSKAHNQEQFYSLFDKIFVLTLDQTVLLHRLNLRRAPAIGKTDEELSDIFTLRDHFERSIIQQGALAIDVSKPVSTVVDSIVKQLLNTSA